MCRCKRKEDEKEKEKERRKQDVEEKEERPGVPLTLTGGEAAASTLPQTLAQRRPSSPVDMGKTVSVLFARGLKQPKALPRPSEGYLRLRSSIRRLVPLAGRHPWGGWGGWLPAFG